MLMAIVVCGSAWLDRGLSRVLLNALWGVREGVAHKTVVQQWQSWADTPRGRWAHPSPRALSRTGHVLWNAWASLAPLLHLTLALRPQAFAGIHTTALPGSSLLNP